MPMDLFQQFIYFTMVATIYLSPILVVLIITFLIKKKFKAIMWTILSAPLTGLALWGFFYLSIFTEMSKDANHREDLSARFDLNDGIKIYQGAYVGLSDRGSEPRNRIFEFYQVEKHDKNATFIVSVPARRARSAAYANFKTEQSQPLEPAYLILVNTHQHQNYKVAGNPEEFIQQNFPSIPESVSIHNIFILKMNVKYSVNVFLYWSPIWRDERAREDLKRNPNKPPWLWTHQKVYFTFLKGNRDYI
ncbi:hypothetical protein [Marinicella meishanensis]|uniref:hypothetical protein n=1 Tax=Marinicella meishanensis TaxID=2873263 RepID=UPI001CBEFAED|nr:hypothetical protein [Marinicella sp. NBU2979]